MMRDGMQVRTRDHAHAHVIFQFFSGTFVERLDVSVGSSFATVWLAAGLPLASDIIRLPRHVSNVPTCDIEVHRDRAESIGKHVTSAVRRPLPFAEPGRQRRRQDCNLDGLAQPSDAAAARDCAVEKSRRKNPPVISKNAVAAAKRPQETSGYNPAEVPGSSIRPCQRVGLQSTGSKGTGRRN